MPAPQIRSIIEAGRAHANASISTILSDAINSAVKSASMTIVVYAASLVLAIAAVIFLFTLADRLLSPSIGGIAAAAVMIGINLFLMLGVMAGRAIFERR